MTIFKLRILNSGQQIQTDRGFWNVILLPLIIVSYLSKCSRSSGDTGRRRGSCSGRRCR